MRLWFKRFFCIFVVSTAFTVSGAMAQTQSFSFGNGLGTLTYNVNGDTEPCTGLKGFEAFFTDWSFSNFKYIASDNTTYQLSGFTSYVDGLARAQGSCPATYAGRTITASGSGFTMVISPGPGYVTATISVPGYINPKYVIVGVIYAPPGSKSFVDYSNTNFVSNTASITNTFINSTTKTVKITTPGSGLSGFFGGTQIQTQSTTLTQTSQTSSSVTSSYTSTQGLKLFGPGPNNNCGPQAGDYIGVDHDCDLIKVWVNPVMLFTLTNDDSGTIVQWNGYGFSTLDTTAPIHIVDILVGCLNGDIATSDSRCAPSLGEFQRTWAAGENWPSGQGPGLTQNDLNNILAADPWGQCKPSSLIGSSTCPTYSVNSGIFTLLPPQFTLSNLQNIPYTEGAPQTTWSVSTTNSNTQGQQSQTSFSQTYGVENAFSGTNFLEGFGANVSISQTLTWVYAVNNQTTNSITFAGQASIIGPACNGNPCTPPYPPNPALYGTGTEFDIFWDHFFGTFVFVPSSYQ